MGQFLTVCEFIYSFSAVVIIRLTQFKPGPVGTLLNRRSRTHVVELLIESRDLLKTGYRAENNERPSKVVAENRRPVQLCHQDRWNGDRADGTE